MITVLRCGHDSNHPEKFHMLRKTGVPHYILLLVKTDAYFELDGVITQTGPNMAILFDRDTYMHYGCDHAAFSDDWIHFDFEGEPSMLESLSIPMNRPLYLPRVDALSNLVRMLVQESLHGTVHREEKMDAVMRLLLLGLDAQLVETAGNSPDTPHRDRLEQLRMDIHNTPHLKWSVSGMAKRVRLSTSHFQHLYRVTYGISCMQEVIGARIERAKFHLVTTDMTVGEVAEACGFENESHFIRLFRKREGMTPLQYRRVYRTDTRLHVSPRAPRADCRMPSSAHPEPPERN